MKKIRVAIWGFGAVGQRVAKLLSPGSKIEIVGVCDIEPSLLGKNIYSLIGKEEACAPLIIEKSIDKIVEKAAPDICICTTDSYLEKAFLRLKRGLDAGMNMISTAEEMIYPFVKHPEMAEELDKIAHKKGVTLLGAGINPGYLMDILVLFLTGCMGEIEEIEAIRYDNICSYNFINPDKFAIGQSKETFEYMVDHHHLSGCIGFEESMFILAAGMGITLEKIEQELKPIIVSKEREASSLKVAANSVVGVKQYIEGWVKGRKRPLIRMVHHHELEPEKGEMEPGDYINIKGVPNISLAIKPEINSREAMAALSINMVPHVVDSAPGLKTMLDMPLPRALAGALSREGESGNGASL